MSEEVDTWELLKSVSRSFYLSVRFLPPAMREPIALGYLLARFTDTIADAPGVENAERLAVLDEVKAIVQNGEATPRCDLSKLIPKLSHEGERNLLSRVNELFGWLSRIDPANRDHLNEVILTIIHGQCWDIRAFGDDEPAPCQSADDLLRYTYWVAGCVGEFWTKVGFTNLGEKFAAPEDASAMLVRGRKLGQGLQLINILRDLHEDLPAGRCYLPADELSAAGWSGDGMPSESELSSSFHKWVSVCQNFLEESDSYIQKVRDPQARFCTRLPRILAGRTADALAEAGLSRVLTTKIKVPRSAVWKSIAEAVLF